MHHSYKFNKIKYKNQIKIPIYFRMDHQEINQDNEVSTSSLPSRPPSPGPDLLLDLDILSGATSPSSLANPPLTDDVDMERNWASDGSPEFRELLRTAATQVANSALSEATVTTTPAPPSPSPPPSLPTVPVAQVSALTRVQLPDASSSPGPSEPMGPPRSAPVRVNELAYCPSLRSVFRVMEFYRNGRVRIQDPTNARWRPLVAPTDLVPVPIPDQSNLIRDLRDQNVRLRRSREAYDRDLVDTTEQLNNSQHQVRDLQQQIEDLRTSNRLLTTKVDTLEQKERRRKNRRIRDVGCNTEPLPASPSGSQCTSACRHIRRFEGELRSMKRKIARLRSRSSSSSSESDSN